MEAAARNVMNVFANYVQYELGSGEYTTSCTESKSSGNYSVHDELYAPCVNNGNNVDDVDELITGDESNEESDPKHELIVNKCNDTSSINEISDSSNHESIESIHSELSLITPVNDEVSEPFDKELSSFKITCNEENTRIMRNKKETNKVPPDAMFRNLIKGSGPFKCNICSKTITRKNNFKRHLMKHERVVDTKYAKCEICNKVFPEKRLVGHMNVHTKPHICNICGRGFRLSWDLKHHIFTHTGERPYPCDLCGKNFGDKSARRKHYQTHTGEKPYSCETCQRAFSQLSHLREHQVTHTKEKSHTCELCGKKFTTKSSLQRHVVTHTNACDLCNQTFRSESNLLRHRELHNVARPYACLVCDKRFIRKADVYSHAKMHSSESDRICKLCTNTFKSSRSLRMHHYNAHPNVDPPFICNICKRDFFSERDLKKHLLIHKAKHS